jgi:hypothetical protein
MDHTVDFQYLFVIILIVEFITLVILVLFIIGRRIWVIFKERKTHHHEHLIAQIIMEGMKYKNPTDPIPKLKPFASDKLLLAVLEHFDHLFSDEKWVQLKRSISTLYLLPSARKWANNPRWIHRNFSARCFALTPFLEDKTAILTLIDDPIFLVRSIAALAALRLETEEGITKLVQRMSYDPGYARYFYRDLLLQGNSPQFFAWIKTIAFRTEDFRIHLACLDILANKTISLALPFLRQHLESNDLAIRLAAIKVFAHHPQTDSAEVLLKYFEDPHPEIRAEAARGIEHFATEESFEKLAQALMDEAWIVRLQAARSLRRMGETGWDILKKQKPEINQDAYGAAQYALQFDW